MVLVAGFYCIYLRKIIFIEFQLENKVYFTPLLAWISKSGQWHILPCYLHASRSLEEKNKFEKTKWLYNKY